MLNPLNIFNNDSCPLDGIQLNNDIVTEAKNSYSFSGFQSNAPVYQFSYDGTDETCLGKPIKDYTVDHRALAMRSLQAYYDSDLVQMVINNDLRWVIGSGLNLKSTPNKTVLNQYGIDLNSKEFSNLSENFFKVVKKSKNSTYSQNENLDQLFYAARLEKLLVGDGIYIYRIKNGTVTAQFISGLNIWCHKKEHNGNRIVHGVEIDATGKHVAYWVKVRNKYEAKRLPAYTSNGLQLIYMGYASKYRIDDVRGMPLLSALLQISEDVTDYRKATVGSAKERENIPFTIEHGDKSTGEDPMKQGLLEKAAKMGLATDKIIPGYNGYAAPVETANNIATTSKKTVYNLPIDSQMKVLDVKNNLYFKEFFRENFGIMCAAAGGQPPEIVLQKFEGSFSSSRMGAAIWNSNKNFLIEQEVVSSYRPYVNIQNEVFARTGVIKDSNYLKALNENWITKEAANRNQFVGRPMPHVDPVKEIKAERAALGEMFDKVPLTTPEDVTERMGYKDYDNSILKATEDFKLASTLLGLPGENNENVET